MIGLLLIAVMALYALPFVFLVRWAKPYWAKGLIVLVAVAIPTWDWIPQKLEYERLCRTEAGTHFYSEPVEVSGFYDRNIGAIGAASLIKEAGFEYIETESSHNGNSRLMRVSFDSDGTIANALIDSPSSRYEKLIFSEARAWGLVSAGQRIVDRDTSKVLAENPVIYRGKTWIFRVFLPAGPGGEG